MAEIEFLDQPAASQTSHGDIVAAELVDPNTAAPHGELCSSCGSPVERNDHFCPACGAGNPLAPPMESATGDGQKPIRCETCGAQIRVDVDQRSYVCPFCDSTYVVELPPETTGRQPPEFVIGFAIAPERAQEIFRAWIADNSWFRPGDLKESQLEGKLRGIYLPFWSFSMLAESEWHASIGEHWYRTETYTTTDSKGNTTTHTRTVQETEWWPLAGRHHRYYAGYLVSASRGLPQQEADQIKPFHLPALKRYEPYFLAGWMNEEYSIDRAAALQVCQQEFFHRERQNVAGFLPGDTHNELQVRTEFSGVTSDLCLLPVYILSYRYGEKLFRFLINGQTGRIVGHKPVSNKRIAAVVLIALGILAAIILFFVLIAAMAGR